MAFEAGPGLTSVRSVVRLRDGSWVLLDRGNREVYVFDSDGRFSHPLGRSGQGPGEFNEMPTWIAEMPDGALLIRDWPAGQFHRFDAGSGFLEGWDVELSGSVLGIVWQDGEGATVLAEESASSAPNERARNPVSIVEVRPGSPPGERDRF